jgi:hypothetical protein
MSDLPYKYGYPEVGDFDYERMMEEQKEIDDEDEANRLADEMEK